MKKRNAGNRRFLFAFVFLAMAARAVRSSNLAAETIRERAENHFAVAGWSVNTDIFASRDRNPVPVPGGNETFAAMTVRGDSGLVAIYPEIGDLGALDYSGIDNSLLDTLGKITEQARERKLDSFVCAPDRNFLSPVTTWRLSKLPAVTSVWHSRPVVEDPDAAGGIKATSVMQLMCSGKEGPVPLRITISLSLASSSWYVEDISMDGKVYATLAQQN